MCFHIFISIVLWIEVLFFIYTCRLSSVVCRLLPVAGYLLLTLQIFPSTFLYYALEIRTKSSIRFSLQFPFRPCCYFWFYNLLAVFPLNGCITQYTTITITAWVPFKDLLLFFSYRLCYTPKNLCWHASVKWCRIYTVRPSSRISRQRWLRPTVALERTFNRAFHSGWWLVPFCHFYCPWAQWHWCNLLGIDSSFLRITRQS